MTYRELLEQLKKLDDTNLDREVMIALKADYDTDIMNVEYFMVENEWVEGPTLVIDYERI